MGWKASDDRTFFAPTPPPIPASCRVDDTPRPGACRCITYLPQVASAGARFLESTQPTRSPLRPGNFTWHHGFWQPPASLMHPVCGSNACTTEVEGDGPSCT